MGRPFRRDRRKDAVSPHPYQDAKTSFVSVCCGSESTPHPALDGGIQMFTAVAEKRMRDYEDATTNLLNVLLKTHDEPPSEFAYLQQQMQISTDIIKSIEIATNQTTIEDIVDQLFDSYEITAGDRGTHKNVACQLVFAAIGWSTMLYTAVFDPKSNEFLVDKGSLSNNRTRGHRATELSQRPVGAMLRAYGLMPIACPPGFEQPEGLPKLLSITQMNFASLSTLGDVNIYWVDNLSEHCEFDRYGKNKELKLFRLPSLCAKNCLSQNGEVVIGRLFKNHTCSNSCPSTTETVPRSYLIEVLLSYRLLFGQHRRSRKLFHDSERESAKIDGKVDPLLDALCSDKDMSGFPVTKELLRERGVYNAQINFPHLGARLIELADYSACQRPRNLWEVWNDPRDPDKNLTFRAVIIVGIISTVLGVAQIAIGLAQVFVSLNQN